MVFNLMRYLSLIAASFLLVGCAQSTDVQSGMTQDTDIQTQQETESTETEIETETEEESIEALEQDPPAETEVEEEFDSEPESESEPEEVAASEEDSEPADENEELESDSAEEQAGEEEQSEAVEDDAAEEEVEEEEVEVPAGYTISDVRDNDNASSCWAAIDGSVYDLTDWINKHPGGASRIISLCGTDATTAFNGMHGGQSRPESTLDGYLLGPLS